MAQVKFGKVVSAKMNKTAVVEVHYRVKHALYKKQINKTKKFKARDEIGVKAGDLVKIEETTPFSKEVHFKIVERTTNGKAQS